MPSCADEPGDSDNSEFYLFVGTYTAESSEGIYVYKFDAETGETEYVSEATGHSNPSYLAISPNQEYVYAVSEGGAEKAGVSAFSFDKDNGSLTFLNRQSSGGAGPCYVSVDATGKAVFAGNYSGGSLAMLPVQNDGSLAEAKNIIQHSGSSVNESRQNSSHVHCTYVSPDNKRLFVADLGTDTVTGYAFEEGEVVLDSTASSTFETTPGAGPRHLTFHPNGEYAYLVNELNGTVDAFKYEDGALNQIQNISTLPEGYDGAISGADIHVSPDGEFLYASNREDLNNIVIYAIDQDNGELSRVGQHASGGVHPRNFMIDPTGRYLLVANRNTDNIVVFKRNQETGMLTDTGRELEVSMPVCLKMMPVK
ncbi:lactonase family protein [Aliifodinibius sp. 1BSP15-2V2]|uniref:Lactonase family protein n=1 Tax=Fodinibius salsisoli TaxID=2820877 RepID=A0ABT3PQY5_9BACT|nr:lactonase family protein [Fodinibius salsisoli]MCW9708272.1 lactonase family protein [Fodinibius salsisoli]